MAGKISLVLNIILIAAVGYLFTQLPAQNNSKSDFERQAAVLEDGTAQPMKIGYLNLDSLNTQYLRIKEMQDLMTEKNTALSAQLQTKRNELIAEVQKYEKNIQRGVYRTPKHQEVALEGLQKIESENMQYEQVEVEKLDLFQIDAQQQAMAELQSFLDVYCADNGYDQIISYTGINPVAYFDKSKDRTEVIVAALNEFYSSKKTASKSE